MKKPLELYGIFFKVGALTFGGGYSMMPTMEKELSEKRDWLKKEELLDFFAVGQCMPGLIAVNTGVMVGNHLAGVPGAIASALGVVSPSVIIILIIASFLNNFAENAIVMRAFAGIRIAVAALIVNVVINSFKSGVKNTFTLIICIAVFVLSLLFNISPIIYVLSCALLGILYKLRLGRKK